MSKGLGSLAEGAAEKNNLFRWIIIFFGGFASWRFCSPHKDEGGDRPAMSLVHQITRLPRSVGRFGYTLPPRSWAHGSERRCNKLRRLVTNAASQPS